MKSTIYSIKTLTFFFVAIILVTFACTPNNKNTTPQEEKIVTQEENIPTKIIRIEIKFTSKEFLIEKLAIFIIKIS